jgi:hypothetical protein
VTQHELPTSDQASPTDDLPDHASPASDQDSTSRSTPSRNLGAIIMVEILAALLILIVFR